MLQHEQSGTQSIVHLVSKIQSEEIQQLHQRRELGRQKISLPVRIECLHSDEHWEAVSRDLSPQAIGLITNDPFELHQTYELQLHHSAETNHILAECVWCEPLGPAFYSSAWEFGTDATTEHSATTAPFGITPF